MTGRRGRSLSERFADLEPETHLPVDAIVAFVDSELAAAAHERAAEHVRSCRSCAAEVAAQRRTRGALRSAAEPAAPASLVASLQSIPQVVELPETLDNLAVTQDGVVVSVAPPGRSGPGAREAPHGSRPLGSGSPPADPAGSRNSSRFRRRQGAGTLFSGLMLGVLIMLTPGGTPISEQRAEPAPPRATGGSVAPAGSDSADAERVDRGEP